MLVRLHNFAATTLHRNSINSQSVRTLQPRSKPMLPPISPGIQQRKKEERKKNKNKNKHKLVGSKMTNCNCNHLFRPYIIFQKEHTRIPCVRYLIYSTFTTKPTNFFVNVAVHFHPWFKRYFLCFGVWYFMTIMSFKQRKILFKRRIKFNHNMSTDRH